MARWRERLLVSAAFAGGVAVLLSGCEGGLPFDPGTVAPRGMDVVLALERDGSGAAAVYLPGLRPVSRHAATAAAEMAACRRGLRGIEVMASAPVPWEKLWRWAWVRGRRIVVRDVGPQETDFEAEVQFADAAALATEANRMAGRPVCAVVRKGSRVGFALKADASLLSDGWPALFTLRSRARILEHNGQSAAAQGPWGEHVIVWDLRSPRTGGEGPRFVLDIGGSPARPF